MLETLSTRSYKHVSSRMDTKAECVDIPMATYNEQSRGAEGAEEKLKGSTGVNKLSLAFLKVNNTCFVIM